MKALLKPLLFLLLLLVYVPSTEAKSVSVKSSSMESFSWSNDLRLPSLDATPNKGVAGAFGGFSNDWLILAGGANFPKSVPWEGGVKQWYRTAYIRKAGSPNQEWIVLLDALPRPLAYGASIQLEKGVLCIGGCDDEQFYSEVFLLTVQGDSIRIDSNYPSLPVSLANMTASLIDNKVFVAGGQESMHVQSASSNFFMLDLADIKAGWKALPSWPGAPRGYAVSAGQSDGFDKCFYLFSGRNYHDDVVDVLTDGYAYNPRLKTWKKLKGYFPVMAGAAVAFGANHILFLGAVPQMIAGSDFHPGFDNKLRVYHTITNTFIEKETVPFSVPVTSPIIKHDNSILLGSGEIKPGIRTPYILEGKIIHKDKGLGLLNIMVIVLYFLSLSFIGFYFSKKQKNANDYFKGGGRLPWWAVGLSIFGTGLSAITFMAIPAKAYATDWSYTLVNAGILLVVPFIIYLFIPFFRKLNVTTAYEYLELRFNAFVRIVCSISFILFQIGRMGVVLLLPAIALNVVTGFDIFLCIGLMGVLSLVYTMVGGIEAVVWTDALQVIVLMGGAILILVYACLNIDGGLFAIVHEAAADSKFHMGSTSWNLKQSTIWTVLIATFFTNLTTYGTDQTMVQRYMTTSTEKQARKSVMTNAVLTIPATIIFFFVGTVLYVFYKHFPTELSLTITDGDAILPWYIFTQLPQGVTGLLISGIFAAAMSTLSSSMNSAATAYVVDIHSKLPFGNKMSGLRTAQFSTLLFGVIGIAFAYIMATWEVKSLWDEFNRILGLILGSMGGLFLLGMTTKRANASGAICGIITSVIVQLLMFHFQCVHLLLYTTTGFISCYVVGYLSSFLFKRIK